MAINYDPDQIPALDAETMSEGLQNGLTPVNIICDEPGAKAQDQNGVSFAAFLNFLPRSGERIVLQDGTTCEVRRIYHRVVKRPGSDLIVLVPTILATRLTESKS